MLHKPDAHPAGSAAGHGEGLEGPRPVKYEKRVFRTLQVGGAPLCTPPLLFRFFSRRCAGAVVCLVRAVCAEPLFSSVFPL